jgi:hypothetical protein
MSVVPILVLAAAYDHSQVLLSAGSSLEADRWLARKWLKPGSEEIGRVIVG